MSGQDGLEVRLLGPVEARRDGAPVDIGGARQRALLALLAVDPGRTRSVDDLVEELWSGEPTAAAATSLRSYVSRLRRSLGDDRSIVARDRGYALDVSTLAVDASRFESLVRRAEADIADRRPRVAQARLREALELWRGEPFGGVPTTSPSLAAEVVRLDELRVHALELRIATDLDLDESASLVDELEALVREHPYRERLWQQLMLALYRAGRQADALAAYHRARGLLDEDLGIEPGPDLEALQAAILRQDVPDAAPPPEERHNLPAPLTSFVGRVTELEDVAAALAAHRLVTLVGVGGVGKTRLAIEVARRVVGDHPDGVWFVDLSPLSDPELVSTQVAATLLVQEQEGLSLTERVTETLRAARAVLVLDNCEHVRVAVAGFAAALLAGAPDVRVLATSREVLGVPGELDLAIPPLGLVGDEMDPAAARGSEAVRLFLDRATEARPGLVADDATLRTVARICADLDGLPLGIELAAARARVLAPDEIATRLRDRFRFLVSWRQLSPARHRTLREAMDWSYDLLSESEQRVLRAISVFAGGFTLEAVAAVCLAGDEDAALGAIERLVEASLVSADTVVTPTRYRILETVRQYAAEALDAGSETAAARDRHLHYFADVADANEGRLRTALAETMAALIPDRANFRAAFAWARDSGDWTSMARLAVGLWWLMWVRGELSEARAWLELAARHPIPDRELHGRAMQGLAGICWAQADYDASIRWGEAARATYVELGLRAREGGAMNTLGLAAHGRLDLEAAAAYFEGAIERYRERDLETGVETRDVPLALDNLASVMFERDDRDRARALYLEALALNTARGNALDIAINRLHLGVLDVEDGRSRDARPRLAAALEHYRGVGFLQYAAESLEAASGVAIDAGEIVEAAFMLGAASRFRDEAGSPPVPFMGALRDRHLAAVRAALGDEAAEDAMAAGRAAPPDSAMQRAIDFLRSEVRTPAA